MLPDAEPGKSIYIRIASSDSPLTSVASINRPPSARNAARLAGVADPAATQPDVARLPGTNRYIKSRVRVRARRLDELLLEALADCEDVPFRVLEPCSLRAAAGRNAVRGNEPWDVGFLEDDAAALEFGDFGFAIINLPVRLAGLGGTGVRRRIEEHFGATTFVNHTSGVVLLRC